MPAAVLPAVSSRITIPQIALRLSLGRQTVYAMLEQRLIPAVRIGKIVTRYSYERWERSAGMTSQNPGGGIDADYKRTYASGKTVWSFVFSAPGATRAEQRQITESGFATKREAEAAESQRRVDEQKKYDRAKVGDVAPVALAKTLHALLNEFIERTCPEEVG
jgi:excisionase family DNA binding protein